MYRVLGRQSTLLTETEDAAPKAAFSLLNFSYLNVFKNLGSSARPTICWEESSIARTRMVRSSASRWPLISRCDTPAARHRFAYLRQRMRRGLAEVVVKASAAAPQHGGVLALQVEGKEHPRLARIEHEQVIKLVGERELFQMLEHLAEVQAALLGEKGHRAWAGKRDGAALLGVARVRPHQIFRKVVAALVVQLRGMLAQIQRHLALEAQFAVFVAQRVEPHPRHRAAPLAQDGRNGFKQDYLGQALLDADNVEPELADLADLAVLARRRSRRGQMCRSTARPVGEHRLVGAHRDALHADVGSAGKGVRARPGPRHAPLYLAQRAESKEGRDIGRMLQKRCGGGAFGRRHITVDWARRRGIPQKSARAGAA